MTTRTIPSFAYAAPGTLQEAIRVYTKLGSTARILAGGTDLLVRMKFREITPRNIVDISHIKALKYLKLNARGGLVIGALTTLHELEDPLIEGGYPAIHESVENFASVQVREVATVGGNLCNASPSADLAPPFLVAEAKLKVSGPRGARIIPIEHFFKGPCKTALRTGEILTEVRIPNPEPATGSKFIKLARSMADLAKVSVAVLVRMKNDRVTKARIALGAVAPVPMRSMEAEKTLEGKRLDEAILEEVAEIAASDTRPITDVRSTADYRRKVAGRLVKTALVAAADRARRECT